MKFEYFAGEQRSKEWFELRQGKITASRLKDWMAVSIAKGKEGTPLKARFDYERELLFEREFGVSFDFYVSEAMEDGINYEDYALKQYQLHTGNIVRSVGAWYNDYFVASPDGAVTEKGAAEERGLAEVKVVRANTFTEVLAEGAPTDDWWKQIQGQLFASGADWCDFIVLNLLTRKLVVIRVKAVKKFHRQIEESIKAPLSVDRLYDPKKLKIYDLGDAPYVGMQAQTMVSGEIAETNNFGF